MGFRLSPLWWPVLAVTSPVLVPKLVAESRRFRKNCGRAEEFNSRTRRSGIQWQMFFGTGKPPWRRITDEDLSRTLRAINAVRPSKILLSAHDSCDHAIARFERELLMPTVVLKAGNTYRVAADVEEP